MNHTENKKTTKMVEGSNTRKETKKLTQEQLQREYDYMLAQKLLKSLLENSLVTEDEFHKITALNRRTFSPFLAELMP